MYVGRFVVVAPGIGAYRVSSRSFPNRRVLDRGETLTVGPTPDAPETDNPYVSYNCARAVRTPTEEPLAVVGNGSHVDPIAEKLELGYPARDALATPLLALDFEKDDYDTPRIAGVVGSETATVGVVRRDALLVETVDEPTIVATYETDSPEPYPLAAAATGAPDAGEAASEVLDADFEHPVCAAGATVDGDGVTLAFDNGDDG
ncbi:IMP cyclohydrolase [Halorubrum rutilum]|uniref:IMP cyclohydrolase n=1 Tax=Halorubrum rutilum TaxID=1364933 RepID=A0ABD6AM31_9EURY|nr:IMP cyclohydrolase [Halorubrum rutilum]